MSSLQKRFSKMQLIFVVLAVLITAQMLILFLLHRRQAGRLDVANDAMKSYMELVKEQNVLFGKIYTMADGGDKAGLSTINEEVRKAKENVLKWGQASIDNSLISSAVIEDEKRRTDSLQKSAELLWQQKYKEAMNVVTV